MIASVVALTSVQLWAKNNTVATPAPAPGTAAAAPEAPETLANLGDRRLMNELADRGLDTLLERYFDLHKTPEAEQKAIRSMGALPI